MNTVARSVFLSCAVVGVSLLVGFVVLLGLGSVGFFGQTSAPPLALSKLLGTSIVTSAIAFVFTVPIGLCSALYLSEFADARTRRVLESPLQFLARVPPVVYGYFAVSTLLPTIEKWVPNLHGHPSVCAGIALSGMLVPRFLDHAHTAIATVPRELRDGACALGAGKFVTAWFVVLPAVRTRLAGALVSAASRAIGETMIVALAAGSGPNFTFNPFEPAETMTGYIARISGGDVSYDTPDYNSIFAIGLLLFSVTLALNVLSRRLVARFREVYE